ncbi:Branched-chain-amino-acid aminotransferase 2 chloroplastic [Bienertia sinuspersici]
MAAMSSSISLSNPNGHEADIKPEIDWDNLGFGIKPTDYMYMMKCSKDEEFTEGKLIPYGNIEWCLKLWPGNLNLFC